MPTVNTDSNSSSSSTNNTPNQHLLPKLALVIRDKQSNKQYHCQMHLFIDQIANEWVEQFVNQNSSDAIRLYPNVQAAYKASREESELNSLCPASPRGLPEWFSLIKASGRVREQNQFIMIDGRALRIDPTNQYVSDVGDDNAVYVQSIHLAHTVKTLPDSKKKKKTQSELAQSSIFKSTVKKQSEALRDATSNNKLKKNIDRKHASAVGFQGGETYRGYVQQLYSIKNPYDDGKDFEVMADDNDTQALVTSLMTLDESWQTNDKIVGPEITRQIRGVLAGTSGYGQNHQLRLYWPVLPALTATLLVAEGRRRSFNALSFLLLLDLTEGRVSKNNLIKMRDTDHYFNWASSLCHLDGLIDINGWEDNDDPRLYRGGDGPMCHEGSYTDSCPDANGTFKYKDDIDNDPVRIKEGWLLAHWLKIYIEQNHDHKYEVVITEGRNEFHAINDELTNLFKEAITKRLSTMNYMLGDYPVNFDERLADSLKINKDTSQRTYNEIMTGDCYIYYLSGSEGGYKGGEGLQGIMYKTTDKREQHYSVSDLKKILQAVEQMQTIHNKCESIGGEINFKERHDSIEKLVPIIIAASEFLSPVDDSFKQFLDINDLSRSLLKQNYLKILESISEFRKLLLKADLNTLQQAAAAKRPNSITKETITFSLIDLNKTISMAEQLDITTITTPQKGVTKTYAHQYDENVLGKFEHCLQKYIATFNQAPDPANLQRLLDAFSERRSQFDGHRGDLAEVIILSVREDYQIDVNVASANSLHPGTN